MDTRWRATVVGLLVGVVLLLLGCHRERFLMDSSEVQRLVERSVRASEVATVRRMEPVAVYDIKVEVKDSLDSFHGTELILYPNRQDHPLREIVLHLYPNSKSLVKDGQPNLVVNRVQVDGRAVKHKVEGVILRVVLPRPLLAGGSLVLRVDFHGKVPHLSPEDTSFWGQTMKQLKEMFGRGSQDGVNFGVYAYGDGILSLGEWFPIVASYGKSGWDVLQPTRVGDFTNYDIAHFRVALTVPKGVRVATSGVEVARREEKETTVLTTYAGAMRDFTIQCSRSFATLSQRVNGCVVNSYYLPEHYQSGKQALHYAARALDYFSETIAPYPYQELDVVEAPLTGGAGGMEYPGLVTIASMIYALPLQRLGFFPLSWGQDATDLLFGTLEFVVVHEVAHQWWHALVGSDSKRHPFMDEALANYSTILYFEDTYGEQAARRQLMLQCQLGYQLQLLLGGDRPVDKPCTDFGNLLEYAAIVYGKGTLFFASLREKLGKQKFKEMLQRYARRYRFQRAEPEGLLKIAEELSNDPDGVRRLAHRWLKESHGEEDVGHIKPSQILETVGSFPPGSPEAQQIKKFLDWIDQLIEQLRAFGKT